MTTRLSAKTRKVANYCSYCPKMCRFSCPVAAAEARETVTPWGLMNLLHAVQGGGVELDREVGEAFFHCTGCLRCRTWCRHDNDIPEALVEARQAMVERGVALPEAFQGADLRMEAQGCLLGPVSPLGADADEVFDARAEVLWFPACGRRAEAAESVVEAGRVIERLLGERVAVMEEVGGAPMHCCGESLRQVGYTLSGRAWKERVADAVQGYRVIVTDCAHMVEDLRERPGAPRVWHIAELIASHGHMLNAPEREGAAHVHDSCGLGRGLGEYEAPRRAVEAATGQAPEELWQCRDQAPCCGGGGVYPQVDPEGSAEAGRAFAERLVSEGVREVVMTQARCAAHVRAQAPEALVVRDLVEVAAEALGLREGAQGGEETQRQEEPSA